MSKKISQLDAVESLSGSELLAVVQEGVTKSASVEGINSAPLAGDRTIDISGHLMSFTNGQFGVGRMPQETEPIAITDGGDKDLLVWDNSDFSFVLVSTDSVAKAKILGKAANDGEVGLTLISQNDTGETDIRLVSQIGTYSFDISSFDGSNTVEMLGDAVAQTITLTAANGTIITLPTSDPAIAGALWNNSGTITISAG